MPETFSPLRACSITAQNAPPPQEEHPFSCSTNLSNDVDEYLALAHLGSLASSLCFHMRRKTFGNAGWHRKEGRSELSCQFDLARWAEELHCDRSDLRKVREKLQACHILTFTPHAALPGCGLLTWNITFAEWLPFNQRIARRQQANVVKLQQADVVKFAETELSPVAVSPEKEPRSLAIPAEKEPRQPACEGGKITTLGSLAVASQQVASDHVRKSYVKKEDEEEKEHVAPDGAEVMQEKLFHFGDTAPKLRALPKSKPAPPPSHSQVPVNASTGARLSEEPTKESPPPNPLLVEQRRLVAELQQKAGDANWRLMSAKPEEKYHLRNLADDAREAVEQARDRLREMEVEEAVAEEPEIDTVEEAPQAALVATSDPDPATWQSQLFGGLCQLIKVEHASIKDTPLEGQIGKAAALIKKYHRRPDELPGMWAEFRRRWSWKTGRSIGGLVLDFASNAAVL